MTKLAQKWGDRMLGLFLKQHDAGACVPNYGKYCGCYNCREKHINCYGGCSYTQLWCC